MFPMKNCSLLPIVVLLWSAQAWTNPFPRLTERLGVRGYGNNQYGIQRNNTIPDPVEMAAIVGVKPCMKAPKVVWKYAWRLHGAILPILHLGDKAKPRDSKYSLKVLWCKAIASMDRSSKVYDEKWTYDTLPSTSRWILRLFPTRAFPRLHHANIEARTAYLNKIIQQEIDQVPHNTPIRLISLGAGYDSRCSRLLSQYPDRSMDAYEMDLENVVDSKQKILDRIRHRRPNSRHPTLVKMDLNQVNGTVKQTLDDILVSSNSNSQPCHVIFVSEGVMIYLQPGVPTALLRLMRDSTLNANAHNTASFCFADRLEKVPGGALDAAQRELAHAGWELLDFCPKPGLARHMGVCRLSRNAPIGE